MNTIMYLNLILILFFKSCVNLGPGMQPSGGKWDSWRVVWTVLKHLPSSIPPDLSDRSHTWYAWAMFSKHIPDVFLVWLNLQCTQLRFFGYMQTVHWYLISLIDKYSYVCLTVYLILVYMAQCPMNYQLKKCYFPKTAPNKSR